MCFTGEMTSKSSDNPSTHPIQSPKSAPGMAGVGPDAEQEASFFRQHGLGPGETAARITGTVAGEKQEDDEVIPSQNPPHSKNVGGIAVANDTLLFQKLQLFNRSKTQERRKLLYSALFIFFPHLLISKTGQVWYMLRDLAPLGISSALRTCQNLQRYREYLTPA